jgi:hypothetical protein
MGLRLNHFDWSITVMMIRKSMMTQVRKIAEQIASKSPLAMRGVKEMLLYSRDNSVASGLNHVATWNSRDAFVV